MHKFIHCIQQCKQSISSDCFLNDTQEKETTATCSNRKMYKCRIKKISKRICYYIIIRFSIYRTYGYHGILILMEKNMYTAGNWWMIKIRELSSRLILTQLFFQQVCLQIQYKWLFCNYLSYWKVIIVIALVLLLNCKKCFLSDLYYFFCFTIGFACLL